MARQIEGVDFCNVQYHAQRIADTANAAYWLETAGAHHSVEPKREDIRRSLNKLAAIMGLRLVDAEDAAPLDRVMLASARAMIGEEDA